MKKNQRNLCIWGKGASLASPSSFKFGLAPFFPPQLFLAHHKFRYQALARHEEAELFSRRITVLKHHAHTVVLPQVLPQVRMCRFLRKQVLRTQTGQMSYLENLSDGEYEAAIAAAAYAITTVEGEEDSLKQKKTAAGLARAKSNLGEKSSRKSFNWSFKWLSGKDTKEGEKETGDTIWHNAVEVERTTTGSYSSRYSNAGEEEDSSPTFKKMPTFTRKYPNEKGTKRIKSGKDIMEGIKAPSTSKPTGFLSGNKSWDKDSNELGTIETEADAWEKAEMIKAKNRYEKMLTVISQWQIEKKEKARRQMEKKEGGPAYKRAKALQRYNNEISRIDKIAGEAKALAKERKQNDEAKIREKVAKIRLTGKIPGACCSCL